MFTAAFSLLEGAMLPAKGSGLLDETQHMSRAQMQCRAM